MEGDCDCKSHGKVGTSGRVGTDAPNGRGLRHGHHRPRPTPSRRSVPTPRMEGDCDTSEPGSGGRHLIWSVPTPRMEGDCDASPDSRSVAAPASVPTPRMEGDCDRRCRSPRSGLAPPHSRSVPTPRMEGDCDSHSPCCSTRAPDRPSRYRRPEWKGIATSTRRSSLDHLPVLVGTDAPNGRGLRHGVPTLLQASPQS